ncbi:MAG: sugar ABC transporter permease, partial [Firmicutes bacterium]|nr:sugar ABC transporter permease [Bacillota bacterium]
RWHTFWSIVYPHIQATILIVLVVRTMEAFKVFDIIFMMTRGGPANGTQTVAYYTYTEAFSNLQLGTGAALSYLIALFILGFAAIYVRLLQTNEK